MKKVLLALTLSIALAGCATTYKPSTEMTRLKAGMDNNQAKQIFYKNLLPSKGVDGLCSTSFSRQDGKPPKLIDSGYSIEAWRVGDFIREEADPVTKRTMRYYKKIFYTQELKFADITKIRVKMNGDHVCGKGDYFISLHEGLGKVVGIVISRDSLDPFLAAVSTLAPNAKLIEGVGL
jgi:hypothetical protein